MKNIIGVFPTKEKADIIFVNLIKYGYESNDISVVLKENIALSRDRGQKGGVAFHSLNQEVLSGKSMEGMSSVLLDLSAFLVPGLGAVLIAGPIANVLKIGGASVTISGIVTGALAGGLSTGLVELGFKKKVANNYEKLVKKGGILIYVPVVGKMNMKTIKQIFLKNDGRYISEN